MTKLSATFLAIVLEGNVASIVVGTIAGSAILEALVYLVILFGNRVITIDTTRSTSLVSFQM